ncbi:MAG: hypothetical protein RR506_08520, partial [Akkermansia sp.]
APLSMMGDRTICPTCNEEFTIVVKPRPKVEQQIESIFYQNRQEPQQTFTPIKEVPVRTVDEIQKEKENLEKKFEQFKKSQVVYPVVQLNKTWIEYGFDVIIILTLITGICYSLFASISIEMRFIIPLLAICQCLVIAAIGKLIELLRVIANKLK